MSAPPVSISTIPAGLCFADTLAEGLLEEAAGDPLALSRTTVLLPTRRAVRALGEAFLRVSQGRPLLLPRMRPLGDLDADELLFFGEEALGGMGAAAELPPAMPALRRQLLLAQLILAWSARRAAEGDHEVPSEDQAVQLAAALAALIDQVETEGLSFDQLADLVPDAFAAHWQTTLRFLEIVTAHWPAVERDEGCIGPAERRRLLMEAQADAWRRAPAADPVIVAGSTGSIPATAALIDVVASLPRGAVVLPGLDLTADEEDWAAVLEDPAHPQHGMARLLERLAVGRDQVGLWRGRDAAAPAAARARFVNLALLPAARTARWHRLPDTLPRDEIRHSLASVKRIDCPGAAEEALVIALLMRRALETDGRRAALVTPDRGLARRVAAELKRWRIAVDDSAGTPLAETGPGVFLRATAEMMTGALTPVALLAALKHPLAGGGEDPAEFRARVRSLERRVLRGARPAPGFEGLLRALDTRADAVDREAKQEEDLRPWVRRLAEYAGPFATALAQESAALGDLLAAHLRFAEALAASDAESGATRLWDGEAGEALAGFFAELLDSAGAAPPLEGARYAALLSGLMQGRVVRPSRGTHPRLAILGPLEARLQQVDTVILGGLNEGTWPADSDPGPWLSRPMRVAFGLPAPERRIGLSAHDFAQAFSAPEVFLTRATRVEGSPTVPSRWLLRLDALLKALDLDDLESPDWQAVAEGLDAPEHERRSTPPAPRPPVAARPRKLSVTQIETWMRDPYQIYARHILKLVPLPAIDQDPSQADLGSLVHAALERFVETYPDQLPPDPEAALIEIVHQALEPYADRPGLVAFWAPRFARVAGWVAARERLQRITLERAYAEVEGHRTLRGPGGDFVLTAKADRIDVQQSGHVVILDYKTGATPVDRDIALGLAPQLPLEAAIAEVGGFGPEIPAAVPFRLEHWRLTGREPAGKVEVVGGDLAELVAEAVDGLQGLIDLFDRESTPYHAQPRPDWAPRYNDYEHLERVRAWSGGEEGS